MNKRQKLVQQAFLDNEEEVLKRLDKIYGESLSDIEKKAKKLQDDIEELDKLAKLSISDEEREVLLSRKRAKVYQKQYQESLKKQVSEILDKMHTEEFKTVSEYLDKCYEEGFVGTLYDLQGQGLPLAFPIDQEAMVRAVQLDSKISKGLYSRLGEDVSKLKRMIASDVSRGISTGMTFKQIAGQLKAKTNIGYNNAVRIARTEGHRLQCQAGMDACYKAKEMGADVVKQWDSTLDSNTRESHVAIDGQIRELDERFSNGLMFPGDPSGGAAEVINCRCALLQRARKALDDEEFTKINNFTGQLETFKSPEEYDEFKKAFFSKENRQYMDYVQRMEDKYQIKDFQKVLGSMTDQEYKHYSDLLRWNPFYNKKAKSNKVLTNTSNSGKIVLRKFQPASSIDEAKEYAKNVFGLDVNGWDDMNLDVANVVNREIQAVYDIFGDLSKAGELTGIRVLPKKQSYVAAYSPTMKEIFFTKNNVGYKTSMTNLAKLAKQQKGFGFWSTDAAEHSIRHELGHAIQHMMTDAKAGNPYGNSVAKLNKISKLRQQVMKDCGITQWSKNDTAHFKPAGDVLSYYALKSDGEFIADSVAEYMAGNPREMAKKVVEILRGR